MEGVQGIIINAPDLGESKCHKVVSHHEGNRR